mgnify:CR=1 FL=1
MYRPLRRLRMDTQGLAVCRFQSQAGCIGLSDLVTHWKQVSAFIVSIPGGMYRPLRQGKQRGVYATMREFQSQAGCIGLSDFTLSLISVKAVGSFNPRRDVSASQTVDCGVKEMVMAGFNPRRDVSASQTLQRLRRLEVIRKFQSQAGCIGLSDKRCPSGSALTA